MLGRYVLRENQQEPIKPQTPKIVRPTTPKVQPKKQEEQKKLPEIKLPDQVKKEMRRLTLAEKAQKVCGRQTFDNFMNLHCRGGEALDCQGKKEFDLAHECV